MADFQDTIKEKFNSFLSSANTLRQSATETIKEGLETGKEKLQEWDRDRRANDIYQNLGKKIYKLSNRGEIELPECCDKYIQALNELYADDEVEEAEGTEGRADSDADGGGSSYDRSRSGRTDGGGGGCSDRS